MSSTHAPIATAGPADELAAQRGSAKSLLLTMLGEFVLPSGGSAWTSSLVAGAAELGIGEKNARQAIARIGEHGLVEPSRHGRRVRWSLTADGRRLLESGAERIYSFGTATVDWRGVWLMAHCPIAESQRALRNQLRTRLGFLGFGELSASLLISPHPAREPQLRAVLHELGLLDEVTILRSTAGSAEENAAIVRRAWDLDGLARSYESFVTHHARRTPRGRDGAFRAVVELVDDWRRFPFTDPELPTELLPEPWAGATATHVFHRHYAGWSPQARAWFAADADRPTS